MAAKTLADLFGPFIKGYSGSYNDRLYAWLQDGAPGWINVIDPDEDGIPGGGIPGGGGPVDPEEVEAIVIQYLTTHPQGVDPEEVATLIEDYLTANPVETLVNYASLPAGTTIMVLRASNGVWPNRPTSRTDIFVLWVDKTALSQSDPAGYILGIDTIVDKGSII